MEIKSKETENKVNPIEYHKIIEIHFQIFYENNV